MQASKRRFTEVITGSVQYVIPVFQRDYNWSEDQCRQLWDDIYRVGERDKGTHFFGSVVYLSTIDSGAAFTRWMLIDGQQRITTICLLMAAVRDHMKESGGVSNNQAAKLEHNFLINAHEPPDQERKLVLRDRDDATFRSLIVGGDLSLPEQLSPTVMESYDFFRDRLKNNSEKIDIVINGVGRLEIVDISLERGTDNAQQIFESLNSTGLQLTQADQIRNYILMALAEDVQTNFYRNYWQKLEHLFFQRESDFDNFLRDFIALDQQSVKQSNRDQVYALFRVVFDEQRHNETTLRDLLERMLTFGSYYAAFVLGAAKEFPETVLKRLGRIRQVATTPSILIMRLLDAHKRKQISESELISALELIESYLVRRDVCGQQTRSYWQQFARLAYRLNPENVLGSLQANLHRLEHTNYKFPTDREFRSELEVGHIFGRRICRTILVGLENRGSKEKIDTRDYTVEHVMPQNENLRREWREMLGENWQVIHAMWLHRLGNLTLTKYNTEYSDRPFEEKKSMQHGFEQSPLRLNRSVAEHDKWGADEMNQRGRQLAERALGIWADLQVSDETLSQEKVHRLLKQTGDVAIAKSGMSAIVVRLFDEFRKTLLSRDSGVIEVPNRKSISYYSRKGEFICEVLPRTNRILVQFDIEPNDVASCGLPIGDTNNWKYFVNSQHNGRSFVNLYSKKQVNNCIPVINQALIEALV